MFANTTLGSASGPPHGRRLRVRWRTAGVVVGIGVGAIGAVHADPSLVLPSGLPVQVKPTFQEPGLPAFSFPVGGSSSMGGSSSSVDGSGGSGSGGSSGGSVSSGGSGDAYNTMMAQDWGSQAADAAAAMGVSATALAATCVMEFELSECWRRVREQRDRRVPNDQLDLHSRHQRRGCLRSGHRGQHCFRSCGTDGSCDRGVCRIL